MQTAPTGSLTTPCLVHLDLSDGLELDAVVYLPTDATRPGGLTSLEAVLDGARDFIPIRVEGRSSILSRDAIRSVEMAADGPGAPDLRGVGGSFDVVTLHLDSGKEVSGILRAFVPVESMRMSDFFNGPDRFLALGAGDRVFLVSKAHLVRATF